MSKVIPRFSVLGQRLASVRRRFFTCPAIAAPLRFSSLLSVCGLTAFLFLQAVAPVYASEKDLVLPDLSSVQFVGIAGSRLLTAGLAVCLFGLAFGLVIFQTTDD